MKLRDSQLKLITGGNSNISGSLLSAVATLINTVLGVGRTIGSAIRMVTTGTRC